MLEFLLGYHFTPMNDLQHCYFFTEFRPNIERFLIIPVILWKMELQLSIQWLEINDSIYDKKNKNYRAFLLSYWMVRAVESADQCSVAEYNTARKIKGKK